MGNRITNVLPITKNKTYVATVDLGTGDVEINDASSNNNGTNANPKQVFVKQIVDNKFAFAKKKELVEKINSKAKKSRMRTLVVVILDESGSMDRKFTDVTDGFNHFIDSQRQLDVNDEAKLFLVKFNTTVSVVWIRKPIKEVPVLDEANYIPGGGTALYDAVAEGIRVAEKGKRSDEKVLCVIITDGEENSSEKATQKEVRELITSREKSGDWTFIYLGENPEKWSKEMGTQIGNVAKFNHHNLFSNFEKINKATTKFRNDPDSQSINLIAD